MPFLLLRLFVTARVFVFRNFIIRLFSAVYRLSFLCDEVNPFWTKNSLFSSSFFSRKRLPLRLVQLFLFSFEVFHCSYLSTLRLFSRVLSFFRFCFAQDTLDKILNRLVPLRTRSVKNWASLTVITKSRDFVKNWPPVRVLQMLFCVFSTFLLFVTLPV